MIEIQDIKSLSIKPGQVLVVQVDGFISTETKDRIKAAFAADAPMLEDRLLVIDKSITLAVVES